MIKDSVSKIKTLFQKRKFSYNQVFNKNSKYSAEVLEDLARFCRANETTFTVDERMTAVLEGRREVWLRIQNYVNLSVEDLYTLHHIKVKGE
jgi:hypothetical protein